MSMMASTLHCLYLLLMLMWCVCRMPDSPDYEQHGEHRHGCVLAAVLQQQGAGWSMCWV